MSLENDTQSQVNVQLEVEQPPVEQPQVEQPQFEQPQFEQPQVEQPQVEQPPVQQPPVEQPQVEPLLSALATNIKDCRESMVENILRFLKDDCYVYIMETLYNKFLAHKAKGNTFYTESMHLTHEFVERISNIYIGLNTKDPRNQLDNEYYNIVKLTVSRINNENHGLFISVNKKNTIFQYDLVFVARD